jgi:hypothetical protein
MKITINVQFDRDLTKEEREALMLALAAQMEEVGGLMRGEWSVTDSKGEKVGGDGDCWFIL